jgi:hypothetical protein
MKKTAKAKAIIKLLKQGYSPREVTHRMDVSYNYAWKVKKQLAAEEAFSSEEVGLSEEALIEVALAASQGKGKPMPTPKPEPEVEAAATTIRPSYDPEAGEYVVVEGAKSAQEVDAILGKRGEQYGSFMQSADTVVRIKGIMHNVLARNEVHLYPDQLQALDMIATKISRIVHGNPNHLDSWIDIAGYATLVADRLQGKIR